MLTQTGSSVFHRIDIGVRSSQVTMDSLKRLLGGYGVRRSLIRFDLQFLVDGQTTQTFGTWWLTRF